MQSIIDPQPSNTKYQLNMSSNQDKQIKTSQICDSMHNICKIYGLIWLTSQIQQEVKRRGAAFKINFDSQFIIQKLRQRYNVLFFRKKSFQAIIQRFKHIQQKQVYKINRKYQVKKSNCQNKKGQLEIQFMNTAQYHKKFKKLKTKCVPLFGSEKTMMNMMR
ncbi:unnamed protein product [Paramecium sonneborni]|uniref:Uncharacterized protein n=1 Tax=Paramecium sonneborni TaxID=65129 RepID=A0A8S1RJI3_9CILI|nr:unnamed protein product [Paramecium sonneborni]